MRRIRVIWRGLDESGLSARMRHLEPDAVDTQLVLTVHTAAYLELLERVNDTTRTTFLDPDTYAGPRALDIALLSAGGAVRTVDEVMNGSARNALAVIRPPGHHAMPGKAMGFCLLGNVAIATRYAQSRFGVDRVMIVDYDVHHGNGTEAMFYDDPSVLYISTHQYPFYPATGAVTDIGTGPGEGYTVNIPLPAGSGDINYARAFERIIWPAADRFQPQLVLVSLGFDAYWDDPLAEMRLTLSGYSHLGSEVIRMAHRLCDGKIVFMLEGGYNLDALRYGMSNVSRLLLGDSPTDPLGVPSFHRDEPDITRLISKLQELHRI
jgi:acetoin utilization deacetylase AcuC-like enzyme